MSYPGAIYSQAINYSRGTTKVEALMNRIATVTDKVTDVDMSAEEASLNLAHLSREMRSAKRLFEANTRALDTVDSLINQLY